MKTRLMAILAVLVLLITCAVVSVSATDEVQPNAAPAAYDGSTGCPHCGKTDITWTPLENKDYSTGSDLHLVVEAGTTVTVTSRMDLNCTSTDAEIVIWVKGNITFSSGITLFIGNSYASADSNPTEVWFVGGGGTVGGTGYNNANNGNLRIFKLAQVYITNAITFEFDDPADNAVRAGVWDINKGTLYMQGGTINGYDTTNSSTKGGAVYLRTGESGAPSKLVMTAGTINGGNVPNGGAIYINGAYGIAEIGGTANVYGGEVGTATSGKGGAIYQAGTSNSSVLINGNAKVFGGSAYTGAVIYSNNSVEISGQAQVIGGESTYGAVSYSNSGIFTVTGQAQITGGTASSYGGALYNKGTLNITGGTISGGVAASGGTIATNGGTVTVSDGQIHGGTATNGGAIYLHTSAKNFNITGGTISGGTATNGGVAYISAGEMGITGGTVNGGTATNGGAIYVAGGALTMNADTNNLNGGVVNGSIAEKGGAIYVDESASFTMTNGTVNGCNITDETTTVIKGGAIYSAATGETAVQLNGGTVNGGTIARAANTTTNVTALEGLGGAIYVNAGYLNIGGAKIADGKAHNGGSLYIASGTVKLTSGTITGGDAIKNGGCVYVSYTTNDDDSISAGNLKMTSGNITSGYAANGGNVYVASRTSFDMEGGSISGGYTTSSGVGGAVYVFGTSKDAERGVFNMSGGTVTADGSKAGNSKGVRVQYGVLNLSGNAKIVSAGITTGMGVDVLYGRVTLDGNAAVSTPAGKTPYDIAVREYGGKVTVNATWTGTSTIRFNHMTKASSENPYAPGGSVLTTYGASTGDFSGELYLASESTMPRIYGKDGKLVFSDVAVCTADSLTWCKNNAEALTVCNNATDKYIKLFNSALTMNGEIVYVDFNGKEVALSGSGTLYGLDSSASTDGQGTAKVTATGVAVKPFAVNPINAENFVALTNDGITTFHVVKPVIDGVSLRPGSAGMYYSGTVICDEVLAGYVESYGIALSLNQMPGVEFDDSVLYTKETNALTSGGSFNGVLVNNIMKAGAENSERAESMVHANAYVKIRVGDEIVTCLSSDSGNAASMSLKSLTGKINAIYRSLTPAQQNALNGMYKNFKADMMDGSWRINNIAAANGDDVFANDEDGVKILMIGNSLSVDAGRMLNYVFALEGYDNVRVSTLYRSGCKLYQHVDHIEDPDNADYLYTFYNSQHTAAAAAVANPASVKPTTVSKKTMLYGIQQDDWDIIVMQQGSSEAAQADTYNEDIQTIVDYVLQNDINPDTKPLFVWNSIWGYPYNADELAENGADYVTLLKRNTGSSTADDVTQIKMVDMITQAAKNKILTNDHFAYVIPSGTAFIHSCAALDNRTMYNDYIHASDMGRLMISYVWYSAITGNQVTNMPDAVPAVLMRSSAAGDRAITANEKTVMLDSIGKAFADPYTMPTGFAN